MKEMNLIGLSKADYSMSIGLVLIPAKSSRDIASILFAPLANNPLTITRAIADEKIETIGQNLIALLNVGEDKMEKSDRFMRIFTS